MGGTMKHQYNDGGREAAGYKGDTGDCGVRAIAIATGHDYQTVYDEINALCKQTEARTRKRKSNARTGVHRHIVDKYLTSHGWTWMPTMQIGSGCTVHMREEELPAARIVCRLSRHFAAVIGGVLHDTYDSSREGTRCVYGYWILY